MTALAAALIFLGMSGFSLRADDTRPVLPSVPDRAEWNENAATAPAEDRPGLESWDVDAVRRQLVMSVENFRPNIDNGLSRDSLLAAVDAATDVADSYWKGDAEAYAKHLRDRGLEVPERLLGNRGERYMNNNSRSVADAPVRIDEVDVFLWSAGGTRLYVPPSSVSLGGRYNVKARGRRDVDIEAADAIVGVRVPTLMRDALDAVPFEADVIILVAKCNDGRWIHVAYTFEQNARTPRDRRFSPALLPL